jgi:radical SAM superfamily enzyme YgiQ (UPF0313 family)
MDAELAKDMKSAGCWGVAFGMESGNTKSLERMGKGISLDASRQAVDACRRAGLKVSLMFLIGLPWDSEQTIRETVDFAKKLPGHVYEFNLAYPFPGTELSRMMTREDEQSDACCSGYDFTNTPYGTWRLTSRRLQQLRRRALLAVYARPSYVLRTLAAAPSPWAVLKYAAFGWNKLLPLFKKGMP